MLKMSDDNMLRVHATLDVSAEVVQTVVKMSKKLAGRDEKGRYRVDTADMLSVLISKFLMENDFDRYVEEEGNYPEIG